MNEITTANLDRIATEIKTIKIQAGIALLSASIEIGRRLLEAKQIVDHGEWEEWLEENVEYSTRTAQNLMKIYDEYGSSQVNILGDAKTQALAFLTYTQAVALLGIPTEKREEFIETNDIDSMSTRELQEAVRTSKGLSKALAKAEEDIEKLNEQIDAAPQANAEELDQLTQEIEKLKKAKSKLKEELAKPREKELVEVVPEAVKEEIEGLKEGNSTLTTEVQRLKGQAISEDSPLMTMYKIQLKGIVEGLNTIKKTLEEVYMADTEEGTRCRGALFKLIDQTKGALE